MSPSTKKSSDSFPATVASASPFPDVLHLVHEESAFAGEPTVSAPAQQLQSPFRSVYELAGEEGTLDPEAEEFTAFLNELYDEEFDEAIYEFVSEADDIYHERFESEYGDRLAQKLQAARLLERHFTPVIQEATTLLDAMAEAMGQRTLGTISASEIATFIDHYQPQTHLSPTFEHFLGGLKNKLKGALSKGVSLAKKGLKAVGSLGLKAVLEKLKQLLTPLLKRVLQMAIHKLPVALRPSAEQLAKRFLTQEVAEDAPAEAEDTTGDMSDIQREFDAQLAQLFFADEELGQDVVIAQYIREAQKSVTQDALGDLDRARAQFMHELGTLKAGEDPAPLVENFIPALLPALKVGVHLLGRPKIVQYLAKLLAKLIQRFVEPQVASDLSQAIVDAGLRLINLETTPEDEAQAARGTIAATVEDTVRQVAALPEYVLDNPALLEAFEQAAAANLPPVLSERTYESRPELRETTGMKSTWLWQPWRGKKHYKKCTRVFDITLMPHTARVVKTFCDMPLAEFLQDRLGLTPGRPMKARVHLYEAIPGTLLSHISKYESMVPGFGGPSAWSYLHPLTPEAAGLLLSQPGLGREVPPKYLDHHPTTAIGQRLYYLEIPEARPQVVPGAGHAPTSRRTRQVHVTLDFPRDQLHVRLFLSEAVAQTIASKLRQRAPIGTVMTHIRAVLERRLHTILSGRLQSHLQILHGGVMPKAALGGALLLLPQKMRQKLVSQLNAWLGHSLSQHLQQRSQDFIAATEAPADGVTVTVTFTNPPGFASLRRAMGGQPISVKDMESLEGMPEVNMAIVAGFHRG